MDKTARQNRKQAFMDAIAIEATGLSAAVRTVKSAPLSVTFETTDQHAAHAVKHMAGRQALSHTLTQSGDVFRLSVRF
jgi:hypothetical protein